ncbi:putative gustatory receptor 36c [Bactrocera dorsalis]|uniref:Gustatory receptor n=1 Tax=Bactrocera dorsalis TaxID=27457 RepID=A0ABM3JH30_BACDO|nr:putative gustatory receptor 36c [Bactrocera dorsalis]
MPQFLRYFYRFTYYYSLAFGLLRFEYDFHTYNIRPTTRVAAYAILVNLLIVALMPQQFKLDAMNFTRNPKARQLFQFLLTSLSLTRSVACVFILAVYWWRRHDIIALVIDFQRLFRIRVNYILHSSLSVRRFRFALLRKLLLVTVTDLSRLATAWRSGSWRDQQPVILVTIYLAILNQVVNHFFFGMCVLNFHLEALNDELQDIVDAATMLSAQRRVCPQNFPRRCANLINKFNALMARRRQLQRFADRLTAILGVQAGCVIFILYWYNVTLVYLVYSLMKPEGVLSVAMPLWSVVLFLIAGAAYCGDFLEVLIAFRRLRKNFSTCFSIMQTLSEVWQLNRYWERSVSM